LVLYNPIIVVFYHGYIAGECLVFDAAVNEVFAFKAVDIEVGDGGLQ
jgi:hypothetical protein